MSSRGIFDVRVWITGDNDGHVYDLISDFLEAAREAAPLGVDVRYSQLRPPRNRNFEATMRPKRRGGRTAA
jgi:hypothetical protein